MIINKMVIDSIEISGYPWRSDTIRPCLARPCRARPCSCPVPCPVPCLVHTQSRPCSCLVRAQSVPGPCPTHPFPSPVTDWHRSPAASPASPSPTPQNPRHRVTYRLTELIYMITTCMSHFWNSILDFDSMLKLR
jgi:hypothetical protein